MNKTTEEVPMNKLRTILMMLILIHGQMLWSQRDTTLVQEAEFDGELKIHLRDAGKIPTHPEVIEQRSSMEKLKFSFLPSPPVLTKDPEKIAATKINVVDKLPNLQNFYLRAGMGNYLTPTVDAYFSSGRNKKGDYGVEVHHLSSNGGVVGDSAQIKSAYSETSAGVFGRYFFKNASLQLLSRYSRNQVGLYGNQPGITGELDSLQLVNQQRGGTKQLWQNIASELEYKSFSRDSSDMNYHARLKHQYGFGQFGEKENIIEADLSGDKLVNSEVFAVDLGFQTAQLRSTGFSYNQAGTPKDSSDMNWRAHSQSNTIFRFQPSAYTLWRDIRAKVGMGVYFDVKGDKPAHFYPMLELKWSILDGLFLPYAGVKGGVELNSFHALYEQNPFVLSNPLLLNRNNKLEAYGGLNGVISSKMGYELGANWNMYEQQAFFVNDSSASNGNRFIVLYNNMNQLNAHGRFYYRDTEHWEVDGTVHYFYYQVEGAKYAWNMPTWKGSLKAMYRIHKQWQIGATVYYVGARKAFSYQPMGDSKLQTDVWENRPGYVISLKDFVDASIQVNYQYNKQVSAWAGVYNTLAQRYQIWNAYPQQRALFMMGATLSF
jgi:hypothetical protein